MFDSRVEFEYIQFSGYFSLTLPGPLGVSPASVDKSVRNGDSFTRIPAFHPSSHLIAYILSIGDFILELPYLVVLLGKSG